MTYASVEVRTITRQAITTPEIADVKVVPLVVRIFLSVPVGVEVNPPVVKVFVSLPVEVEAGTLVVRTFVSSPV